MDQEFINIAEAKARLSHYIRRVRNGERLILCERNVPVAELRPLETVEETAPPYASAGARKRMRNPVPATGTRTTGQRHPARGELAGTVLEIADDFDQPEGDTDWEASK